MSNNFEEVGIRAVVKDLGTFMSGTKQMQSGIDAVGKSASSVASDTSKMNTSLSNTGKAANDAGGSMKTLNTAALAVSWGALTLGAERFTGGIKGAYNSLLDLTKGFAYIRGDSASVKLMFGDMADAIFNFADIAAESIGVSAKAFNQLATPLGSVLKNIVGLNNADAAQWTIDLAKRGADLAFIYDTDVESAILAVGSAIRGETEPIRQYGVAFSDAEVTALALAQTGKKTAASLTLNEKAFARLSIVMAQTDNIAGSYADNQGLLFNSMQRLQAEADDLAGELGAKLYPIFQKLVGAAVQLPKELKMVGLLFSVVGDDAFQAIQGLGGMVLGFQGIGSALGFMAPLLFLTIPLIAALSLVVLAFAVDAKGMLNMIKDLQKYIMELGRLLMLGFNGGQIGGEFDLMERAAFKLGQTLRNMTDWVKQAVDDLGELSHLFGLGFAGGSIGGQFTDLERAAFKAGEVVRELADTFTNILVPALLRAGQLIANDIVNIFNFLANDVGPRVLDMIMEIAGALDAFLRFTGLGGIFKDAGDSSEAANLKIEILARTLEAFALIKVGQIAFEFAQLALHVATFPLRVLQDIYYNLQTIYIRALIMRDMLDSAFFRLQLLLEIEDGLKRLTSKVWTITQNVARTGAELITDFADKTQVITQKILQEGERGAAQIPEIKAPTAAMLKQIGSAVAGAIAGAITAALLAPGAMAAVGEALAVALAAVGGAAGIALGALFVAAVGIAIATGIGLAMEPENLKVVLVTALLGPFGIAAGLVAGGFAGLFGVNLPKELEKVLSGIDLGAIADAILGALSEVGRIIIEGLTTVWENIPEAIGAIAAAAGAAVLFLFVAPFALAFLAVRDLLIPMIKFMFGLGVDMINALIDGVGSAVGFFVGLGTDIAKFVYDGLKALPGLILDVISSIPGLISSIASPLPGIILSALSGLPGLIIGALSSLPGLITGFLSELPGLIAKFFIDLPTLIGDAASSAFKAQIEGWKKIFSGDFLGGLDTIFGGIPGLIISALSGLPALLLDLALTILDTFMDAIGKLPDLTTDVFSRIGDAIMSVPLLATIVGIGASIVDALAGIWEDIVKGFTGTWDALNRYMEDVFGESFATIFRDIVVIVEEILGGLVTVGTTIFNALLSVVSTVLGFITDVIMMQVNGWVAIFEAIWSVIGPVVTAGIGIVRSAIEAALGFLGPYIEAYVNQWGVIFETTWTVIKAIVETTLPIVVSVIETAFNAIKAVIEFVMPFIQTIISTAWDAIRWVFENVLNVIRNTVEVYFNIIKEIVNFVLNDVWNIVQTVFNNIWNTIATIMGIVADVVGTFVNIIVGHFNFMWDMLTQIANGIWTSVMTAFNGLAAAAGFIFSAIRDGIANIWNAIVGIISGALSSVSNLWNSFVGAFKGAVNWVAQQLGLGTIFGGGGEMYVQMAGGGSPYFGAGGAGSGYAEGGSVPAGGEVAMVGERGPELMFLPGGAQIMPNNVTMQWLGLWGGKRPHGYALGMGNLPSPQDAFNAVMGGIASGWNWIKSVGAKAAVDTALGMFGVTLNLPGMFAGMGTKILGKLVNKLVEIVTGWISGGNQADAQLAAQAAQAAAAAVGPGAEQWRGLVAQYFPASQVENALRIIMAESGGNQYAIGGPNFNGTYDVGLFQINDIHGLSLAARQNAATNTAFAAQLFASSGWRPWSTAPALGLAGGTRNWLGGLAWVGEQGPELVSLPRGSDVYSGQETMTMLKGLWSMSNALRGLSMHGKSGGGDTYLTFNVAEMYTRDKREAETRAADFGFALVGSARSRGLQL